VVQAEKTASTSVALPSSRKTSLRLPIIRENLRDGADFESITADMVTTLHFYNPGVPDCLPATKTCHCDDICYEARNRDCCLSCWDVDTVGCDLKVKTKQRFPSCERVEEVNLVHDPHAVGNSTSSSSPSWINSTQDSESETFLTYNLKLEDIDTFDHVRWVDDPTAENTPCWMLSPSDPFEDHDFYEDVENRRFRLKISNAVLSATFRTRQTFLRCRFATSMWKAGGWWHVPPGTVRRQLTP
jgi:hypothetical protein